MNHLSPHRDATIAYLELNVYIVYHTDENGKRYKIHSMCVKMNLNKNLFQGVKHDWRWLITFNKMIKYGEMKMLHIYEMEEYTRMFD